MDQNEILTTTQALILILAVSGIIILIYLYKEISSGRLIVSKRGFFRKFYTKALATVLANETLINDILRNYDPELYQEANKTVIKLASQVYTLLFFEYPLRYKYGMKYDREITMVVDAVLLNTSSKICKDDQSMYSMYIDTDKLLFNKDNWLPDMNMVKGVFLSAAVFFLQDVFETDYSDFEYLTQDEQAEVIALATAFQSISRIVNEK